MQTLLQKLLTVLLPSWFHKDSAPGMNAASRQRLVTHFVLDPQGLAQLSALLETELDAGQAHTGLPEVYISTASDEQLIQKIRHEARIHNRDNITRTSAYLDFYQRNPAIHWALLAHLVSRNGGWSMTDLQGDPLGRLVRGGDRAHFFQLLERSNFLIFGDAYPQLLIWEASVHLRSPLFHLLPRFGVCRAMIPIWQFYWAAEGRQQLAAHEPAMHRSLLTHALIANEQNFIEQRVIAHKHYQKAVLQTAQFRAQKWLNLSMVLFPYRHAGTTRCRLAGVVVHDFGSLEARIANGKQLYEILFGYPQLFRAVLNWALANKHSGSRSDYLPTLFEPRHPPAKLDVRFEAGGCQLQPGSQLLASPYLQDVWQPVEHSPAEAGDWCKRPEDLLRQLKTGSIVQQEMWTAGQNYDITDHHCFGLRTMLAAAGAAALLTES